MFPLLLAMLCCQKRSNCRCLGCHDAHVASALDIDIEYGSQLYMLIHVFVICLFIRHHY